MRRDNEEDDLELTLETPAPKLTGRQEGLPLPAPRVEFGRPVDGAGRRRAGAPKREPADEDHVADYRHADASRLNAPAAGLAAQDALRHEPGGPLACPPAPDDRELRLLPAGRP